MNHRWQTLLGLTVCWVALAFSPACHHAVAGQMRYVGTIERIQDLAGDHYMPTGGGTPFTRVQLYSATHGVFSILIPGIYSESIYGRVGDSVTFTGPPVPFRGELWMEHLRNYRVSRQTKRV